jgi:dolichol-phosphate mannosyltransferase
VKNEEVGLTYLMEEYDKSILKQSFDVKFILVIDSQTDDHSKKVASRFVGEIIDQHKTTGKGAAIMQAVHSWKREPDSKVIFLDADGSYSFDQIIDILEKLNDYDIVSGSRFLNRKSRLEGMSRLHHIGNKILSMASSLRNRKKITDLCTGLWGFRKNALLDINFKSKGFDLEAEIFGLIRKNKHSHAEIAVEWSQRKGGISKLRSIVDGLIILRRILIT